MARPQACDQEYLGRKLFSWRCPESILHRYLKSTHDLPMVHASQVLDQMQRGHDGNQTPKVAGAAVRVPITGFDDVNGAIKLMAGIDQSHDHNPKIFQVPWQS